MREWCSIRATKFTEVRIGRGADLGEARENHDAKKVGEVRITEAPMVTSFLVNHGVCQGAEYSSWNRLHLVRGKRPVKSRM